MPYGRSYAKKASKAVKKYANKRVAKKIGKKLAGKVIPGYNVYSTADDVYWLGSNAYRYLKNRQLKQTERNVDMIGSTNPDGAKVNPRRGRRKRYGIDDYY